MDTLTGTQLFREWLIQGHNKAAGDNRPYEYKASDGSFILWKSTLDFDYEMSYLLEVRSGDDGRSVDYLFGYEKHAGAVDITVEWANSPKRLEEPYDEWHDHQREVVHRFVDWTYEMR